MLWLQVVVSNDQGLVLMRLQQPDEQGAQSAQFAAANQAKRQEPLSYMIKIQVKLGRRVYL